MEEDPIKAYRPMLKNGTPADVTVDEILDDLGQTYYIRRIDPKDMMFTDDAILRKYMSEKVRYAYENSPQELQPLMQLLLKYAFEIGEEIEEYAAGRIKKEQIPLENNVENDLIIGLLVLLSRDTFIGKRTMYWEED